MTAGAPLLGHGIQPTACELTRANHYLHTERGKGHESLVLAVPEHEHFDNDYAQA